MVCGCVMELKKIKHYNCPFCGSGVLVEQRTGTSGDCTEIKIFDCGLKLRSPIGSNDILTVVHCKQDKKYIALCEKRKKALDDLLSFLDSLDVDNEFKIKIDIALINIITS